MKQVLCSSCKTNVGNQSGTAIFSCPNCSKGKIVRCSNCRKIAAKYTCPECGFTGPN